MVSGVRSPAHERGTESATRHKIAKLARLHLQLSACEEQLGGIDRQPSPAASKEIDRKTLTAKIAAIKAQIAELARSDAPPTRRAMERDDERRGPRARRSEPSVLDAVRLAAVKEGHLGTLVNLRA